MIVTKDLTKTFKKTKKEKIIAVDHINLEIKKGEKIGLIGPNGAGKTTFLKILSTVILPDEGTAIIDGYNVVKDANVIKNKVSLLAGEFVRSLYWRLSGRQNMKFFANLRNMWTPEERIDELLELFNLKKMENELVMKYSTGMKHKLILAIGLLNDPPVIFLDEPLTGIDPVTANDIKKIIKNDFKDKTIIWTSHNLYEIEEMCDRITLISEGKITLEGTPEKLKENYWGYEKIMVICDNPKPFEILEKVEIKGNIVEIETRNVNKILLEIMEIAKKEKINVKEIKTLKPTLEEIFMKVIKNA
jgi:ABC-2 type transport system ATP-binding protein